MYIQTFEIVKKFKTPLEAIKNCGEFERVLWDEKENIYATIYPLRHSKIMLNYKNQREMENDKDE